MNKYDENHLVFNSLVDLEIVIDRPVAQVWRHWLDMGSWVTSHQLEEISDVKRVMGSITRVTSEANKDRGFPPPFYHYNKIIKLVFERQYVFKTYSEKGGSYGVQIAGFDDARFYDIAGYQTRLTFQAFAEYRGEVLLKMAEEVNDHETDNHMLNNLHNLKRIVEAQPRIKG